jgi:hypothetical protein
MFCITLKGLLRKRRVLSITGHFTPLNRSESCAPTKLRQPRESENELVIAAVETQTTNYKITI